MAITAKRPRLKVEILAARCYRAIQRQRERAGVPNCALDHAKALADEILFDAERAGVVVNKADKKHASAHDLRRAFATRWAPRLKPATLQLLMRHESIETTLKYYVSQETDDVSAELWNQHAKGNTSGNTRMAAGSAANHIETAKQGGING